MAEQIGKDLGGKVAVITGASSGIGAASAKLFAEAGAGGAPSRLFNVDDISSVSFARVSNFSRIGDKEKPSTCFILPIAASHEPPLYRASL